jgi:ribosomal protein S18 acetylase RimI-like enzyme
VSKPGGFEIRRVTGGDAAPVVALWTQAYVAEGEGGRTTPYAKADFFETARRAHVLVAERQGSVVGVVALLAPGTQGGAVARGGEAELARLVVAASARRLGIGRALAGRCEEMAYAAGWDSIALWSRRYQTEAHLSTNRSAKNTGPSATPWTRPASSASSSAARCFVEGLPVP